MFKHLFNIKPNDKLSKIEYWEKWDLFELFDDLKEAIKLLTETEPAKESRGLIDFRNAFIEEFHEVEVDNVADFTQIWKWFTPGKEWDNLTGLKGKELGKNIFDIVDRWKRNQDFLPLTKVELSGEFGVVLQQENESDLPGLIRWDSNIENDIEDWRGLFGSFIDLGGKIIAKDYQFKFIHDDGTIKQ